MLKKINIKKLLVETLKTLLILFVLVNIISYIRAPKLPSEQLPDIAGKTIEGTRVDIPENRPLLIHFWATWCPTCRMEAANIDAVAKKFDVITVAVKSGDDDAIKEYLRKNGYSFAVINDKKGVLARRFHIGVYPTTFIYDADGKLLFSETGYTSSIGLYLRMLWAR